jgi:hypothetical protein
MPDALWDPNRAFTPLKVERARTAYAHAKQHLPIAEALRFAGYVACHRPNPGMSVRDPDPALAGPPHYGHRPATEQERTQRYWNAVHVPGGHRYARGIHGENYEKAGRRLVGVALRWAAGNELTPAADALLKQFQDGVPDAHLPLADELQEHHPEAYDVLVPPATDANPTRATGGPQTFSAGDGIADEAFTRDEYVAAYARLKAEGDRAGCERLRREMAGAPATFAEPPVPDPPAAAPGDVRSVPLHHLLPDKENLELAVHSLHQGRPSDDDRPVEGYAAGDAYALADGHHRLLQAILGGQTEIALRVKPCATPPSTERTLALDPEADLYGLPESLKNGWLLSRLRRQGFAEPPAPTHFADAVTVHALLQQLGSPEQARHAAGLDHPLSGLRGVLADAMDETGRSEEAALLRTPGAHVEVRHDGTVKPSFMERQGISNTYGGPHVREQFVKPSHSWVDPTQDEHYDPVRDAEDLPHHSFTYWFATYGHPRRSVLSEPDENGRRWSSVKPDTSSPKQWFWHGADGEGVDPEDLERAGHERYQEYPSTEHLDEAHPLSPSELAWMHHHATTPQFRRPNPDPPAPPAAEPDHNAPVKQQNFAAYMEEGGGPGPQEEPDPGRMKCFNCQHVDEVQNFENNEPDGDDTPQCPNCGWVGWHEQVDDAPAH